MEYKLEFFLDSLETIKALQHRVGDKSAREFLKKLKAKITDSQIN